MEKVFSWLLKMGVPVGLSVLLVYFFYKNVDIAAIEQSLLQDVNYWWLSLIHI